MYYSNFMLNFFGSFKEENVLFLCLRTNKMLSFGVFDRCESY